MTPDADQPVQDLVVIDRQALRQMLSAVLKTLRATANLEELQQGAEADPGQYALLQANLRTARDRLIDGIESMSSGVERLPSVRIHDDD
jgi:hypothetical protein